MSCLCFKRKKLTLLLYNICLAEPYHFEKVQCRNQTVCQKHKPEDYWNTNFYRRKDNFHCGFYTSLTEPYKPIGGEVILDPVDLVLTTLPYINVERKVINFLTGVVYKIIKIILVALIDKKYHNLNSLNLIS